MNLIWFGNRLIATTIGDFLVGLAFLGVCAAAGLHVWQGTVSSPLLVLYGIVGLLLVPIGLVLVFRYRHLVLDFSANTYTFRDGLFGRGRSKAGDIAEIATLKVRIEKRFGRKGWKVTLFPPSIGHTPRDWSRIEAITVTIPHLLHDGLQLTSTRSERRVMRLIERFTSRFPFTVEKEVETEEV